MVQICSFLKLEKLTYGKIMRITAHTVAALSASLVLVVGPHACTSEASDIEDVTNERVSTVIVEPTPTPTPTPTETEGDGQSRAASQPDSTYPKVIEELFTVDFEDLPDNWVGEAIDEEKAKAIFLDPHDLHEYSFVRNGSKDRGFGGRCTNGKDVIFLDESPENGRMMCVRHCAEEKIEENFLHMHWQYDGDPSKDEIVAEYDFIVPECMGDNRNCTAQWGGKMGGLGHGYAGGGKGDECGRNSLGWRKGYPGGSESAYHGMSYRVMWRNPGIIDSDFQGDSYVSRNEACEVRKGHDDGGLLNLEMYIYYWKAKWQQFGGRQGSEVSMCNLPEAGDWTSITLAVDPEANHFRSWINGQLAGAHTAPKEQSCGGTTKDPVEGVSGFFMGNFFGGGTPTGKWATPEQVMCFDNIRVYKTE